MQWARREIAGETTSCLVVWFDLKIFLPWLLSLPGWKGLFDIPKDLLVLAIDPDGFPTYRWAKDKKNG